MVVKQAFERINIYWAYFSTWLDSFHEAEENNGPWEEERQGDLVVEASEVTRFSESGFGEVEHVDLPELQGRGFLGGAIHRDVLVGVAPGQTDVETTVLVQATSADGCGSSWVTWIVEDFVNDYTIVGRPPPVVLPTCKQDSF